MFTLGKKCKIIVVKSLQLWRINWRWRLFMVLLVADQAIATVSVHKCFVLGDNNTCLLKNKVNLQSWTKVLGTVMQYSYYFCHSGSLVKQFILFEIFLQFSLPYPIQRKNSGYTRPTLFVGWGKGTLGLCEMQKCPKTFVHDCSSFNFHLLRTSRKSHFILVFFVFLLSTIGLNGSRVRWLHVRWSLCVLCCQ